jgi:hypothetical protein
MIEKFELVRIAFCSALALNMAMVVSAPAG